MASVLLAGRSGAHHHSWGEGRASLAPIPPNPSPNHHPVPPRGDGSKARAAAAVGYVTFKPASLGHREARALRDRLAGELGQVRALLSILYRCTHKLASHESQQANQQASCTRKRHPHQRMAGGAAAAEQGHPPRAAMGAA